MRQGLRLLLALLVLCSPVAAQTQISTNINEDGDLKVLFADFPASNYHNGILFAQVVSLQVVNQYQCVPSPGNPPVGSIRVYCDSTTGNLTCINSSGGNCGGGGGGGFVFGTGTAPNLAVWTNSTTIGNSAASDNGTTLTYHGTGGMATPSVALTGTAPFAMSTVEGNSSTCLPIADGQDALCSINNLSPAGLWYSQAGAPYVPLAPQGSSNGPIFNDQLISGGGVTWTGLLNFTVSAASYAIVSTNYTSPQTNITLVPADATNPRVDSIVVDNTGTVVVLTGTPAGSPSAPVPDPTSQLQLTTVTVAANATTPTLNNILVYDENVGTPTEWNCTPTTHFNCNSTNNPFHLTHDIEATTAAAGNNTVLAFSSTVNLATYSTLSFNIRNKATWPAAKSMSICFLNSTTIVGTCIGFKNGIFGFNQANVTSYQQIVIPLSAFALTGVVDRVRFQVAGGSGAIGFYLDWIQIQSALVGNGGGGNFQLQVDGTATALTANLQDNASVTFAQTTANGITTIQATAVGAPPSGAAGGDLSGTFPNPTVAKVNGASVPASAHVAGTNSSSQIIAATQTDVSTIGYVAGGGTANAQTATLAPAITGLTNGLRVCWLPSNANASTTPTLAVNGLTAKTIVKTPGNIALAASDLTTTAVACAIYDGTNFELQNPQTASAGGVTSVGLALPGIFTVSGSPVTSSGTLTGTLANENAGTVWAGPATVPGTFASLVQTCTGSTKTTGTNQAVTATCGQPVTAGDQLIVWASENINSSAGAFTITDSPAGDTFVTDDTQTNFNALVQHVISAVGGNTVFTATSTAGISSTQVVLYVMEYRGITAFDAVTFHANNGTPNAATVTTTQANDLLLAFNLNFCTGQSNTNAAFTVEASQIPPVTNTFYYTMAMDSGAAAAGAYTASAACTGVNTMNMIHLAYKTSSVPQGTPSFRKLVASDLPTIGNFLWTSDLAGQTSAVSDTTIFTVGTANADFFIRGNVNCTASSAGATATLNFKWTDTSNTAQVLSALATCTTLGTSSLADMTHQIRALAGTAIKYGVTIASTPTFDVGVRLNAQ